LTFMFRAQNLPSFQIPVISQAPNQDFIGNNMTINWKHCLIVICLLLVYFSSISLGHAQDSGNLPSPAVAVANKPKLTHAAMCKGAKESSQQGLSVVFPIEAGKISCLTSFNAVPDQVYVYHKWFHRDKLTTTKKLLLKPPQWSTMSTLLLREADKGPWRVEITDDNDNVLRVLRFSIVD
jgi:hypothetical protein